MMRSKTNPFVMLNKVQTATLPNVPGHMLDQKLSCNWAMHFKQTNTMKPGARVNNLNGNVIEEVSDLINIWANSSSGGAGSTTATT
jgi:hypothetical protein